ncbi:MAG: FGGY-family carbohydrate kinase [Anaerolineae bacterium]|jgi:xylulokinase|nr:hypothetical protein [Chloroflexota bacterium]
MSLLGLEVGLTGCRALVVSVDGRLLADVGRGYQPSADLQQCLLDVRGIWSAVSQTLKEAAARSRSDPVTSLAIASAIDAFVPLSREGGVLAGCMLADSDLELGDGPTLEDQLGRERIYEITGQIHRPKTVLARIGALRREQPELYRDTWRFALLGGVVAHLLGALATSDYSVAGGTLAMDMHQRAWSREMLAAAGISPAKLPALAPGGTPVGTISTRVAAELDLSPRTVVTLGGSDLACQALGVGAVSNGIAILELGASIHQTAVFRTVPLLSQFQADGLSLTHHLVPDLLLADLVHRAGGAWLRWFMQEMAPGEQRESSRRGVSLYRILLGELPATPSPLWVRPMLDGRQGQAGAIENLTLSTSRGELIKGLLEGAALHNLWVQQRLELKGVPVRRYRVTGGGAGMDRWTALCADVLNRPLERTTIAQGAALGAAMLAGIGTGAYGGVPEAVEAQVRVEHTVEPNPRHHRIYSDRLTHYLG